MVDDEDFEYYNGYPIVKGKFKRTKSTIVATCPYCGFKEHFSYSKGCGNPSKRRSHCLGFSDYYYIKLPKPRKQGGEKNVSKSDI